MTYLRERVEAFLDEETRLPSIPAVAMELLAALDDERVGARQVGAIVEQDPVLTARVLQWANGPAFASRPTADLGAATARIGLSGVREAVLLYGVMTAFDLGELGYNLRAFWTRSVATARMAESVSSMAANRALSPAAAATCFTAGLLHDLGVLVLLTGFPVEMLHVVAEARTAGRTLHDVEQERLGFDHQDVGGRLLEVWRMPPEIISAARFHHHPGAAPIAHRPVVDRVHVAEHICMNRGIADDGQHTATVISYAAWRNLGLSSASTRNYISRAEEIGREAVHLAA